MEKMLFAFYSNFTTVGLQKSNDITVLKLLKGILILSEAARPSPNALLEFQSDLRYWKRTS
jgi:hypothetical protein